jgi:hypothetical protein
MQARKLDYQGFNSGYKPSGGLQNVGMGLVSPARRAMPAKLGDGSGSIGGANIKNDPASLQQF